MEGHTSKRRRVEWRGSQPEWNSGSSRSVERATSMGDQMGKLQISKLVLPSHSDHNLDILRSSSQELHQSQESAESAKDEPTKIQARQLISNQVNSVVQPATDATSTVLAVSIDNGTDVVSQLDVPIASKSVWIPGYGELTMTNDASSPTATAARGTNPNTVESAPGAVTPPPAAAASQARTQALSTQEAIAKELDVIPQAPSRTESQTVPSAAPQAPSSAVPQVQSSATAQTPSTAAPAQQATASQSPMAISVPESRTQQVLSAPATPIPATPQSSASSSASYFSSSSASPPISSPTHISNPPTPSNILNPNSSQLPSSHNITASAATSLGPSAASILSLSSLSSKLSGTANVLFAQSTASQASISSIESLAALASATHNPSGFATSTRNSQGLSSGISSAQITSTPTILASSVSSQLSSQSGSASSNSGGPSSSGIGAGGVGGSGNTAAAPSPTTSSGSGSGGSSTPPTPVLVGGIVGGVAGAALVIFALMLFLRWRRGKVGQRRNISPPIPQTLGPGGVPHSGNMTQRSSTTPIAAAGFFGRLRPASSQTATTADTAPSERGFQKISGRKLPSVLASGGDGYGGAAAIGSSAAAAAAAGPSTRAPAPKGKILAPGQGPFAGLAPALRPDIQPHTLSGSSFYRDSHGFYGGLVPEDTRAETDTSSSPSNSPPFPAPLNVANRSAQGLGSPSNRPPEVANMRPGPARTPVINQPGIVPLRTPSRANQPPPRPARATPPPRNENPFRDGLGRSHPSQDGSRGSRFREDTTPP